MNAFILSALITVPLELPEYRSKAPEGLESFVTYVTRRGEPVTTCWKWSGYPKECRTVPYEEWVERN